MFSVSATCFKTSPFALVNCNCAHDGLRTILHPSLNPHRNHPPNVAAASQALGLGMKQRDNGDDGAASSRAKLDAGKTKLCFESALEAFVLGSADDPASPRRENQIDVWRCEDGAGAQLAGCSTGIQIRLSKFRMLTPSLRPLITQPRLALEFGQLRS